MEKIGVFILFKNSNVLLGIKDILEIMNNNGYGWNIDEEEMYRHDNVYPINIAGRHSTSSIMKIIESNDLTLSFRMIRWPRDLKILSKIDTYNDYCMQKCTGAILCTDSIYFEVYTKSEDECEQLFNKLRDKNGIDHIEYITKENNARHIFHVDR